MFLQLISHHLKFKRRVIRSVLLMLIHSKPLIHLLHTMIFLHQQLIQIGFNQPNRIHHQMPSIRLRRDLKVNKCLLQIFHHSASKKLHQNFFRLTKNRIQTRLSSLILGVHLQHQRITAMDGPNSAMVHKKIQIHRLDFQKIGLRLSLFRMVNRQQVR